MNAKKAGLAIATYGTNYGTYLQAYATQFVINKLGYETEVIRIDSVAKEVSAARKKYFISRLFSYAELRSYYHVLFGLLKEKTDKRYRAFMSKRKEKMADFKTATFTFSPRCHSFAELTAYCRQHFSSVVVGSDQLWRPANIAGNFYTLNFIPDHINKIAYATSFGLPRIRGNQRHAAKHFLSRINHLSARETSGASIVQELTGRHIPVVLDPTLLMTAEEWEKHIKPSPHVQGKYVLCYFLGDNKTHREFAARLAKASGCRIVALVHVAGYIAIDKTFGDLQPDDIGPLEFLNLVKNAQYVCTDSFHGCAFAIQFERKFFAFRRFAATDTMSTNDRLSTLLNTLGLGDCLINGTEECADHISNMIDYTNVKTILNHKRQDSMEYLKKAFADTNTDL